MPSDEFEWVGHANEEIECILILYALEWKDGIPSRMLCKKTFNGGKEDMVWNRKG